MISQALRRSAPDHFTLTKHTSPAATPPLPHHPPPHHRPLCILSSAFVSVYDTSHPPILDFHTQRGSPHSQPYSLKPHLEQVSRHRRPTQTTLAPENKAQQSRDRDRGPTSDYHRAESALFGVFAPNYPELAASARRRSDDTDKALTDSRSSRSSRSGSGGEQAMGDSASRQSFPSDQQSSSHHPARQQQQAEPHALAPLRNNPATMDTVMQDAGPTWSAPPQHYQQQQTLPPVGGLLEMADRLQEDRLREEQHRAATRSRTESYTMSPYSSSVQSPPSVYSHARSTATTVASSPNTAYSYVAPLAEHNRQYSQHQSSLLSSAAKAASAMSGTGSIMSRQRSHSTASNADVTSPRSTSTVSSSNKYTPTLEAARPSPASSSGPSSSSGGVVNGSGYKCRHPGCTAPPFQTQYLLNEERPHFCPHEGCPHSKGGNGRGFKRKNEMKRHQLVHSSPGYTCPFCPERNHKYPRPDNLQRHVKAHHTDIKADDPLLQEVLKSRRGAAVGGRQSSAGPSPSD